MDVLLEELPLEARTTLDRLRNKEPPPYPKDGAIFSNREGKHPLKEAGYYREYTVQTPETEGRGARRIVMGKNDELYYTDDHYQTFKFIIDSLR